MTAHTDQTGEARVRVVDRPQGQAPGMERDYFNSPEYLQFLLDHCTDTEQATEGRIGGGELTRHHLEKFGFRPGERVLEVGCGTGRVMTMLDKGFGADVHGTDVCADAIDHLKRERPEFAARARGLPPGDLSAYPDRSFDAIVYWGVFELCEQRLGLLECSRIIREGGRLLLSSVKSRAYHPDDADMDAAVEAYRTERIPLYLTDVPAFERVAGALLTRSRAISVPALPHPSALVFQNLWEISTTPVSGSAMIVATRSVRRRRPDRTSIAPESGSRERSNARQRWASVRCTRRRPPWASVRSAPAVWDARHHAPSSAWVMAVAFFGMLRSSIRRNPSR
jgi:SAM-dependent methyltransferase